MLLLTLAVVAVIVAIALGRLPGGMPEPSSTVAPVRLPSGPLAGTDVHGLRFAPALRGYRMDQVDDALDRLANEIDRLRQLVPAEAAGELQWDAPDPDPTLAPEGER